MNLVIGWLIRFYKSQNAPNFNALHNIHILFKNILDKKNDHDNMPFNNGYHLIKQDWKLHMNSEYISIYFVAFFTVWQNF